MDTVTKSDANIDKGYAWLVLLACFVMRVLVEGFWSSLGILMVEWQNDFDTSASDVAIIGSVTMAIMFVTGELRR